LHKFTGQKLKVVESRNAQEDWKSKGKRCDARMLWRDGPWTWSMQDAAFLFRELVDAPFDPGACSPLLFFCELLHPKRRLAPCSLGLSATSQQYFSLRTN
jgi:hypothetical protein